MSVLLWVFDFSLPSAPVSHKSHVPGVRHMRLNCLCGCYKTESHLQAGEGNHMGAGMPLLQVQFALLERGAGIHLNTTFVLIFPSSRRFLFSGCWSFTHRVGRSRKTNSQKKNVGYACRIMMAHLSSPTHDIQQVLCALTSLTYPCEQRVPVCGCDSRPSAPLSTPQRGVVLMISPRQRSSWTSAGLDSAPCWQTGWHGWLIRQRCECRLLLSHCNHVFLTKCYVASTPPVHLLLRYDVMSYCVISCNSW